MSTPNTGPPWPPAGRTHETAAPAAGAEARQPRAGRSSGEAWDPPLNVIGDILSGLLSAVAALAVAAGAAVWEVWLQDRPRRKWRRTLRRARWRRSPRMRSLFWIEITLVTSWLVVRSTGWVLWHIPATWRGVSDVAISGWRAGVSTAHQRRGVAAPTRRWDGEPETEADRRFFDLRESGYDGGIDQDGYPVDKPPRGSAPANGGFSTSSASLDDDDVDDVELLCTWVGPQGETCSTAVEDVDELMCAEHDPDRDGDRNGVGAGSRHEPAPAPEFCTWVYDGGRVCGQRLQPGELFCAHHPEQTQTAASGSTGPGSTGSGPTPRGRWRTADGQPTRRPDRRPETDADRRFFDLRASGYNGWINQDGHPVDENGHLLDEPLQRSVVHVAPVNGDSTHSTPEGAPLDEPPPAWTPKRGVDELLTAEDRWSMRTRRCRYVVSKQLYGRRRRLCGRRATVQVSGFGEDHLLCGEHFRKIHGASGRPTRRWDGEPETDADRRFFDLRESGYDGWIDQDGDPVDSPPLIPASGDEPGVTNLAAAVRPPRGRPVPLDQAGPDDPVTCPWCDGRPGAKCEHCDDGTVPAWVVDPAHGVRQDATPEAAPAWTPTRDVDELQTAEDRWSVRTRRCRYVVSEQLYGPGRRVCGRRATVQVRGFGEDHMVCDEHFRKIHGVEPPGSTAPTPTPATAGQGGTPQAPGAPVASGPAAADAASETPSPAAPRAAQRKALMPTTTTTTTMTSTTRPGAIGGDLRVVADLKAEGERALAKVEEFEALARAIKTWTTNLSDRYAAAPFGTKALTSCVSGISQHGQQSGALREQVTGLQKACQEALGLGDHISSVKAEGETQAYAPK